MGDSRSRFPAYPQLKPLGATPPSAGLQGWGFVPDSFTAKSLSFFKQLPAAQLGVVHVPFGSHATMPRSTVATASYNARYDFASGGHNQHQQWQQHQQQQYAAQQQAAALVKQQPWHSSATSCSQVVVVAPHFCLPQRTTLVLQEQAGVNTGDGAVTIMDAYSRPHFTLAPSPFSMHSKRTLLNAASSTPVLSFEKKLFSLHSSWVINKPGDGGRIAKVQPDSLRAARPCVRVFLNRRSKVPDFVIKGNFLVKSFTIFKCMPGGGEQPIAAAKRDSQTASANAFLICRSMLSDAPKFYLSIEPGVDAAFVTALTLMCDEFYGDSGSGF